ncbi:hypothetical protein ACOSQ3_028894 [Xanthoceras sorbifolium]
MDSSKYYFSSEGCSSSESGWTKYMDSPMQEDDAECSNIDDDDGEIDDDNNNRHSNENDAINDDNDDGGDDKEESDDSMASDASSGPSHQYKRANDKANRGKLDHVKKLFSWKKTNEKEKHKKKGK